jgi:hypothetical protein
MAICSAAVARLHVAAVVQRRNFEKRNLTFAEKLPPPRGGRGGVA